MHRTPRNRLLDSHDTHKERTKPWLDLHIICWPKSKDFPELKPMTFDETAFPRYLDQACWKFVCQTFHADIMLYMIPNVCDLDNIWTLDKKCLRVPPLPSLLFRCYLNRFPICALSLWYGTLQPGKVLPGIKDQKAVEIWKPNYWSVILSEKDLDQKGKV